MRHDDLVRVMIDLKTRVERLEASVGKAGNLLPYEPPAFPTVDPVYTEEEQPRNPVKKQKQEPAPVLDETRLHDMSDTELAQACTLLGIENAGRHVEREALIALILGEMQGEIIDPLAAARRKTYSFVNGNKSLMISKMRCSLHCPTCPHHKVVECYAANHDIVDAQS